MFNFPRLVCVGILGCFLRADCGLGQVPEVLPWQDAPQEVEFFDDFTASELDRSKWNVELMPKPFNQEEQAYIDSPETHYIVAGDQIEGATGGVLALHPRFKPGYQASADRQVDFVSSRINTQGKVEFTYGTMAARIKLPEGAGAWPAFWALGNGHWPACGEIDVLENAGDPQWFSVALHGPGYSGNHCFTKKRLYGDAGDATQWHVYSCDWFPTEIVFRIDGEEVYRISRTSVEERGEWKFANPKFLILNMAMGGHYPARANGAKSPYLGIPDATVQLVREDQLRMLVDWVRVTKYPHDADPAASSLPVETVESLESDP